MQVHSKWSFIFIQNLFKMGFRLFHPANAHPSAPASPSRYHPPHGPRLHGASLPGLQHYLPPNWCTSNRWWLPRLPIFAGKWGMWRKRDEQKWQNLNNNGTFSFSFGGVVWKKLNYNMEQHNSEPVVSTSPPKRNSIWNFTTHWWKVGFRSWKWYPSPSPESCSGFLQWKLCATSGTSYGTALPFLSQWFPSPIWLEYREYNCRLFIEICLLHRVLMAGLNGFNSRELMILLPLRQTT